MFKDPDWDPMIEALKEKVAVSGGFEKDIPLYLCDYLDKNIDQLQQDVLSNNQDRVRQLLSEFTTILPRERHISDGFKELYFALFFSQDKKPHLSIARGSRNEVSGEKASATTLDFDQAPGNTTGILIVHTHPPDSEIGLSPEDKHAIQGDLTGTGLMLNTEGTMNQRLKLFPLLQTAFFGLCTSGKPDQVVLIPAKISPVGSIHEGSFTIA